NEVRHLSKFGHGLPKKVIVGTMLEVPSLLYDLDNLMQEADFVSIGSNDLFQFLYAADRGNVQVAGRFDTLGKPFMRVLRQIVLAAQKHETPLTLCGEIAGRPVTALAIRALGISSTSMSPAAIGPVKDALIKADISLLAEQLLPAIEDNEHPTCIRTLIEDFAEQHDITL
ncbi:MAG: putative PEP-binding protein, partial [Pseudomonadota bacterium]